LLASVCPVLLTRRDRTLQEYIDQSAYDTPQKLMLCGWAGAECTASLLLELDQGNFALPHGSEVRAGPCLTRSLRLH
jgi:hypothetical protein